MNERIDARLKALGLALPQPLQLPPGVVLPFPWIRVVGTRALIPVEIEGEVELLPCQGSQGPIGPERK